MIANLVSGNPVATLSLEAEVGPVAIRVFDASRLYDESDSEAPVAHQTSLILSDTGFGGARGFMPSRWMRDAVAVPSVFGHGLGSARSERMTTVCRGFFVARIDEVLIKRVRRRPRALAKRRAYQGCTRAVPACCAARRREMPICRHFGEAL